ncbi:NINE protein [Streptomyces sp. NPDC026673]|uniref:TM2 domain-containing protein n=1 Tax=Streptomyces sp. NPDC026673 TaxID=3155724 RepID=UPI0033C166E7
MSDPNNPYGQPKQDGYGYPQQDGYGYPQQPPAGPGDYGQQPGYGYPQQGGHQAPGYGYPPQGGYTGDPNAPYGYDPYGRPLSDKSKIAAGLLGIFLGTFGVGRFYTGHVGLGVGQLVVSVLTCGFGGIWGLIDGIVVLAGSAPTDAEGRVLRS